jgi:hypothetical protein
VWAPAALREGPRRGLTLSVHCDSMRQRFGMGRGGSEGTDMQEIIGFGVYDTRAGMRCIRSYGPSDAGRRAAYRVADRKDMEYGAVRYVVRPMVRGG